MIWVWVIFFSALWLAPVSAATVSGRVELKDSRDPHVRKKMDFSGVVVSLQPAVPPALSTAHARMLQRGKMFVPHVLPIQAGTTVDFPNLDPIFHNAFSSYNGQLFDVGLYAPGSARSVHFTREGVVRVFCNIHSSMSAVIIVLGTPYFAVSGKRGEFLIPGVPPGDYELRVFHERATNSTLQALARHITVSGTVAGGAVELPPISISESGYLAIPHKNKYGREYRPEPDDRTIYPAVRD